MLVVSQHHVCHSVLYPQDTRKVQLNSQRFLGHSLSKIQNETIWKKTPKTKKKKKNRAKSVCELLYSYYLMRVLSKKMLEITLWVEHRTPSLYCSPLCPCPPVHMLQLLAAGIHSVEAKLAHPRFLGLEGAALHGILAVTRASTKGVRQHLIVLVRSRL